MKLVILDRDGVINYESAAYIKSPDEWLPIPGSLEAIAKLKQAGFLVAVATNQSGIARGFFDEKILMCIHEKMQNALRQLGTEIDLIVYCPHGPYDNCECRKPRAGLFQIIKNYFNTSLQNVPAIGDSLRDIQAATTVGCRSILVRTGKGNNMLKQHKELYAIEIFDNLASAVAMILTEDLYKKL
jgi:D-glycero-D-manno-heptose 1,7-bisphosphate phosphatase